MSLKRSIDPIEGIPLGDLIHLQSVNALTWLAVNLFGDFSTIHGAFDSFSSFGGLGVDYTCLNVPISQVLINYVAYKHGRMIFCIEPSFSDSFTLSVTEKDIEQFDRSKFQELLGSTDDNAILALQILKGISR